MSVMKLIKYDFLPRGEHPTNDYYNKTAKKEDDVFFCKYLEEDVHVEWKQENLLRSIGDMEKYNVRLPRRHSFGNIESFEEYIVDQYMVDHGIVENGIKVVGSNRYSFKTDPNYMVSPRLAGKIEFIRKFERSIVGLGDVPVAKGFKFYQLTCLGIDNWLIEFDLETRMTWREQLKEHLDIKDEYLFHKKSGILINTDKNALLIPSSPLDLSGTWQLIYMGQANPMITRIYMRQLTEEEMMALKKFSISDVSAFRINDPRNSG